MKELSETECREYKHKYLPRILPSTWQINLDNIDGIRYLNSFNFCVIISFARELDNKVWLHFSVSHKKRIPTWDELRDIKELFLKDLKAIQILPAKKEYVNINSHVLHLWSCLDGDVLPDFTQGSGSL